MTFDLCHASLTLTLAHPNPGLFINVVEDPGAMSRVHTWVGNCAEVVLLYPPRKGVVSLFWRYGGMALSHCVRLDVVEAVLC